MTADLLREDDTHRQRALALDSFIVEAPAGAGKTELLTQRYLRLLATVEEPEEVVAITFTNKAAGEMRARIAESLAAARGGVRPDRPHKQVTFELARAALERSAARGWQIEEQPGRMRLTTIDSLCAGLARQMPLLSRFGAQPATVEEAGRHYRAAARRALEHLEDDAGSAQAEAVAIALEWMDNDVERLVAMLADMLARREQWRAIGALEDPGAAIGAAFVELVREELAAAAGVLDAGWQGQWMPLARFAAAQLAGIGAVAPLADWNAPIDAAEAALPLWRALAAFLLTNDDAPRRKVDKREGFPAEKEFKETKAAMLSALAALGEREVEALRRVRRLPAIDHADDAVVRALARLVKLAAAELWLVFRDAGEIDFAELAARAIAALGDEEDPSDLGLRLDFRIRHLLVDEFQDTSPTQVELLERLTAGWQEGDGRTLFLVGDPMQSIYRFRKAEVGLFLRIRELGLGGLRLEPLRLYRNNRACPQVVEWINARFPALFPAADEPLRGEIAYREFIATRPGLDGAGVAVHVIGDGEGEREREAELVAALVAAERAADPKRDIAVLVRARSHLAAIVAALRRHPAGLRFSAIEIEPLAGRQHVQDLISLTRALHHRADRLHWLAVLRAPWCGLTLADLHALAGDDHDATVWSLAGDPARVARLSADGQRRLGHVVAVLGEALAGAGRQRRRRWVEDAWRTLGGAGCLGDAAALEDVRAFFRRLDALDAGGRFDLDALEEEMARLYAAPDPHADGRLQLMTMHKAKGLEFDTVILPGLHRKPRGTDAPLLAWDSFPLARGERLVAAPVNRRGRRGDGGPTAHDYLCQLEAERNRNEATRLLYVAATRTIRRLHIVAAAQVEPSGAWKAPPESTLLARLWPALRADLPPTAPAAGAPGAPAASAAVVAPPLRRLKAPTVPAAWCAPAPTHAAVAAEETGDALAAAVGTLVHAVLELAAANPADWPAAAAAQRRGGFERWLALRGWGRDEARDGAARAAGMLAIALASADGQWLLRPRPGAAAELALAQADAGTRVVDRSFVEDGVRWIIDYKTGDPGAGDAATLAARAGRYRPQLEAYARLFADEGLPQRLAVFWVARGSLSTLV